MGSLMADLENNLKSVNKWKKKNSQPELTQEDLLIKLFDEVEHVWPKMGYPPLVTPFSQYVKNVSLMNVLQMEKGRKRWSMIDENTWGMLMGRSGQLLGPLGEEIQALIVEQKREFYKGKPQDLYPDELDRYKAEMDENGWDYGQDEEELLELAMHPAQYKEYKSGKAKEKFLADLEKRKGAKATQAAAISTAVVPVATPSTYTGPKQITVDVNGEKFKVAISYDDAPASAESNAALAAPQAIPTSASNGDYRTIDAPLEGKFYLTKESNDKALQVGDEVKEGETIAYIEAMKVINAIAADKSGKIVEIVARHGEDIEEDEVMFKIV